MGGGQVNNLRNREFQGEMKVQKHPEIYVSAGLSLGRDTRPQQVLAKKITAVLDQLSERSDSKSPHLRHLRKLQKHHIFSRKKHFLEPVSAETRVQAWPKSQRQGSWQPKSSISDVEAVCRGQVNNLRNPEFQGEMKVQKHLEIDVSAGLSLSEQPAEP